ncbi:MAG: nitrous oxide reductase family maturation protein NosD [Caldilineaceae bacterium]|nr:nitrous oxide reductase family maturation protein NosD [Caldilineaceae bacterium]
MQQKPKREVSAVDRKENCCQMGRIAPYGAAALFILLLALCLPVTALHSQEQPFDLMAALAEAQPGDVIHVPQGTYQGPFQINTSVSLIGEGNPIIQGDGKGDVITIHAPDVILRGFVIRNSGDLLDQEHAGVTGLAPRLTIEDNRLEETLFGIYLKEAPNSIIRNNQVFSKDLPVARRGDGIRVWYSNNALIEDNYVSGSRDMVIWFSPDSIVRNNTVENGRYGLHFMFSDNQLLEGNVLRDNSVGVYLMYGRKLVMRNNLLYANHGPSGYGVGLKDVDDVTATGNRMVANRIGLYVDNSPREPNATVRFDHNLIAYNEIGLEVLPLTKRNTYVENIFLENGEQVHITGGGALQQNNWSVDGRGNYWSDYKGFDSNGDGVGEQTYAPTSLYESMMAAHPELRLFQMSPGAEALDLAARAFPIFEPREKIRDEFPLTRPPAVAELAGMPVPSTTRALITGGAMLALAVVLMGGVMALQRTRRRRLLQAAPPRPELQRGLSL